MADPTTPRRGLLGRLVGTISEYVSTPRRATPTNNDTTQNAQHAGVPSATSTPAETLQTPPQPEAWRPGMIQSKYLLEYENMFDEIAPTPKRRPVRLPQTCPPPKRRKTRAHVVEMPRSAMKKPLPRTKENESTTPSHNKRVKFNENLTQERILSPPQPGERESYQEQPRSNNRKRPRATDPYAGKHFADSTNIFDDESPSKKARYDVGDDSTSSADITPTTQTNTHMNAVFRPEDTGDFVPNRTQPRPGTFELNYDTYGLGDGLSDLSEEEHWLQAHPEAAQPIPRFNPPSANQIPGRYGLDYSDDSINPDDTSSLLTTTNGTPTPAAPSSNPPPLESDTEPSPPPTPTNAPTIDLEISSLPWPQPTTYVEAGIASQHIIDLVDAKYDAEDDFYAGVWYEREFGKFESLLKLARTEGRGIEIEL